MSVSVSMLFFQVRDAFQSNLEIIQIGEGAEVQKQQFWIFPLQIRGEGGGKFTSQISSQVLGLKVAVVSKSWSIYVNKCNHFHKTNKHKQNPQFFHYLKN